MPTEKEILQALSAVQDPELGEDLVTLGMIRDLHIGGGNVHGQDDLLRLVARQRQPQASGKKQKRRHCKGRAPANAKPQRPRAEGGEMFFQFIHWPGPP